MWKEDDYETVSDTKKLSVVKGKESLLNRLLTWQERELML